MNQLDEYNIILAKYDELLTKGCYDEAEELAKTHDLIAIRTVFVAVACDRDPALSGVTTTFFFGLSTLPEEKLLYTCSENENQCQIMKQSYNKAFKNDCISTLIQSEFLSNYFIHLWLKKINKIMTI